MKKHLFGFALFSLIVGATAFGYAMFKKVRVDEVPAPAQYETYSSTKSCWKMKRELREAKLDSPKINQAVFNVDTKEFNLRLETPETSSSVALHFFVKDKKGARYVASEQILGVVGRDDLLEKIDSRTIDEKGLNEIKVTGSYSSLDNLGLDNLGPYENLYVVAEFASAAKLYKRNYQPEFDAAKAVPVLIDSGK
jgi:hypothetical protein